ncbi:hypothetical protein [Arhodomonas sp. KWT]|uniref:hypothetical protein n=1 Tax=Arhodomonas sp. KWT TaxID=2679915 RepID=UPI00196A18FB
MIVVATSSANGCLYCTVSHGAFLRIRAKHLIRPSLPLPQELHLSFASPYSR